MMHTKTFNNQTCEQNKHPNDPRAPFNASQLVSISDQILC